MTAASQARSIGVLGEAPDPLAGRELAVSLASNTLHLIILPTEACNFRCVYCYETFKHGRMSPSVVLGVKRLLARRLPSLSSLTVTWFGGEPLLARDVIEEVMEHVGALSRGRSDLDLASDITTNGYFLEPELFGWLVALGVKHYQISLDGPREAHDRTRVLAGGGGTFDRIWGHLLAMRDAPGTFSILVRVHVSPENEEALHSLVDAFHRDFAADPRFALFIRKLEALGGPNDGSFVIFGMEDGRAAEARIAAHARALGLPHRLVTDGGGVCYASRANSFVVRTDGRVNKCTVALEREENQVGRLREDGTLEINSPRMGIWMRGLWSGDADELMCPLNGV